tara:strand:- start:20 stop:646 length:627 start_codon:yes stop_codon:yes gene_type:complete
MSDPKETPVNEQVENADVTNPADETSREAAEATTAEGAGQQADIIAEKDAEIADLKDKLLRAMAEVENMRRRAEREKQDAHNYAVTKFARDVLSVADNLRRAIDSVPEAARESGDVKNILTGVELTESELLNTMEKHQIRKIDPKGEKFDPNMHQAMFEIEDPSVEPGTVLQVVQAGYSIADRLLRPAMVGVAKGGQKRSETRIDEKV